MSDPSYYSKVREKAPSASPAEIERLILRQWNRDWEHQGNANPYWHEEAIDCGDGLEPVMIDGWAQHALRYQRLCMPSIEINRWIVRMWKDVQKGIFRERRKICNMIGSKNSGKCLHPETLVLLSSGATKRARDVLEGDLLMGPDSKPRKVLKTNTGSSRMVEIIPAVGASWKCNDDHILVLKHTCGAKRGEVVEMTVREYESIPDWKKAYIKLITATVDYPDQDVPVDPRCFGLWLGDGDKGSCALYSDRRETEVVKYWEDYWRSLGFSISIRNDKAQVLRINAHSNWNRNGHLRHFQEKRIPEVYFINSRTKRLHLLAGLIDSDGHAGETYFEYTTILDGLKDDVVRLATSLGFRCSTRKRQAAKNGRSFGKPSWRITICGDTSLVPTLRKKTNNKKSREHGATGFRVRDLGDGEWAGWTLDGDGRFLLADHTITHNSNFFAIFATLMVSVDPKFTRAFISGPYKSAADSTIWARVGTRIANLKSANKAWNKIDENKSKQRHVFDDSETEAGYIELITLDKVGKLQGTKAKDPERGWIVLICDEIAEFPSTALLDLLDNLTANDNLIVLDGCNFKNPEGLEGDLCRPEGKDYSDLDIEEDHDWPSNYKSWTFRYDGHQSPNVIAGKKVSRHLLTEEVRRDMEEVHGLMGPKYLEQIRSFPNSSVSDYFIITRAKVKAACGYDEWVWADNSIKKYAFCDPGFGGDPCRIGVFGTGTARVESMDGTQHNVQIFCPLSQIESIKIITDLKMDAEWEALFNEFVHPSYMMTFGSEITIEQQIVAGCYKFIKQHGVERHNFGYDGSMRAGIVHEMVAMLGSSVQSVDFGGEATERPAIGGVKTARNLYRNFVTELYFETATTMTSRQFRGADLIPAAVTQMCRRSWKESLDRKQVQPKHEYKLANQGNSPNDADVLVGAHELARRAGFRAIASKKADQPNGVDPNLLGNLRSLALFADKSFPRLNRTPIL